MQNLNIINDTIRTCIVLCFAIYIYMKFINIYVIKYKVLNLMMIILTSVICYFIRKDMDSYYSIIFQLASIMLLNIINFKKDVGYTMLNTIISLGISYLFLFITIFIISFPIIFFNIQNDYITLVLLILFYVIIVCKVLTIRKIKNGIIFLQSKIDNANLDILLLNVSIIILFIVMIIDSGKRHIVLTMIIASMIVLATIKKSLDSYYKHNLLIKDLENTKQELADKTKKIEELEKENLNFSKTSHSLAHKQKALEYKINELMLNNEIEEELGLKEEVERLSREVYRKQAEIELSKTEIPKIDNMLKCMQAEAISKNIEFDLQINGNIHYMTNHFVSVDELEILIADHVKDAIIAIEYSENINRSILVKLGKIEDSYGLYIYDSGIEFEKETLENLGKKPITTHADNGGTGMGFMNTFDTLHRHNASLIIQELNEPNKDDFTKVIMIKFDDKNEFKVISYKEEKATV